MKDNPSFLQKFFNLRKFKAFIPLSLLSLLLIPLTAPAQDPVIPTIPAAPVEPPPPEAPPVVIEPLPPKPDYIPPDLVPVVEKLDTFFNTLANEGASKAYPELLKGSTMVGKPAIIAGIVKNTDDALTAFGNLNGRERISIRRTGDRLASVTYIGHTASWPLRWNFVCYYGVESWQILDVDVSNNLDLMIDRGRDRDEK